MYYVIRMGEDFETAKAAHGDNYFISVQAAVDWGKLMLSPGQRFWVCDKDGGVMVISQVPRIVGNT